MRASVLATKVLATALLTGRAPRPAAAAPPAASPEALERARALSDRGRSFHETGRYDRAVDAYLEAYVLAPSPGLLFNLGQAYRLKGDCTNAALMYRAYLRSSPGAQPRAIALAHLATVERCASPAIRPGAGAAAGAELRLAAHAPTPPGRTLQRTGVLTALGGGLLLGVAGYFALSAADASDQASSRYGRGERWRDLEELDARGQRDRELATGFAVVGGAAVVTGAALYVIGWQKAERAARRAPVSAAPSRAPTRSPTISPSFSPAARRGSVTLAWAF